MHKAEIAKESSLDSINNQVSAEEQFGFLFLGSSIEEANGARTNVAVFDHTEDNLPPPPGVLLFVADPQPAGANEAWRGLMLVRNRPRKVIFYRI